MYSWGACYPLCQAVLLKQTTVLILAAQFNMVPSQPEKLSDSKKQTLKVLNFLNTNQSSGLVARWACFSSLGKRYRAGSLRAHNLWNSAMKGCTKSASSVTMTFSMLLCTAVSVQLREPVMSRRQSTTANLWCMYTEPTSQRTQIPVEQTGRRVENNCFSLLIMVHAKIII